MKKSISESESTISIIGDSGSYGPCDTRRESSLRLSNPSSPLRGAAPSSNTLSWVDGGPFEGGIVESISVGSVSVHIPQLTYPIAPVTGFAMQAEVVKSQSKFTEFRRTQRRAIPGKMTKIDDSEGGPFFASRERGPNPPVREARVVR